MQKKKSKTAVKLIESIEYLTNLRTLLTNKFCSRTQTYEEWGDHITVERNFPVVRQ